MKRSRRTLAALLVLIVVLSAAAAAGFLIYRPQPTLDGDERLGGLAERAEVLRDPYGVPHIFARTTHDLFFLQGYVTAQDRLFQLDLYRRTGRGRLSEVLGSAGLETDKFIRTLGLARAADADATLLSDPTRQALAAYADGINRYLDQRADALPLEFLLLGYKPDPWTVTDSLVILKLESFDLATNYGTELARANVAARVGPDAVLRLFPESDGLPPAALLDGSWTTVRDAFAGGVRLLGQASLRTLQGDAGNGLGSNCIALSGSRTASGKPLLEGDPHLAVRNPAIWYEVGLHGGGYEAAGFSIPGLPGIGIGHNARIAWSFAVAYTDVQDFFVEQPDPQDPRRYRFKDGTEAATILREQITVKGRKDPVPLDVVVTRHGPLMTGVLKNQTAPLALRWTALDAGRTMDGLLGLARASDWATFQAAAADISGATLSACYADVEGHIGYLLVGSLPDRAKGDGKMPVPGWTGEYEWRGTLPASLNPSHFDPPEGYIVNANERPVSDPSAVGYVGEWDPGFRAAIILARVKELRGATVESLRKIQTEYTSAPLRTFRDALAGTLPRAPLAASALELVRRWDGTLSVDSAAAAVYEGWIVHLADRTFHDKLGDAGYLDYVSNGRPANALYQMLARPADPWFVALGDPSIRGRDALSALALDDAVAELRDRQGADPAKWRWGALHTVTFAHSLSAGLPGPLRSLFDIGPYERAGDGYSVNVGSYPFATPYALSSHPSLRMVVDLGDLDGSGAVLPTGESGQPLAKHWGDQTPLWLRGELHPMLFTRDRLGRDKGDTLVLRPR